MSNTHAFNDSYEQTTPMLQQYWQCKREHPECMLFFRLGDFYELFFDDAIKAAEALQITLTQRGKHQGTPVPMCGVPVHAYEHYLQKLIQKGFRVAICEQTETPEDRLTHGGKGPLKREITRILTPGTLLEDSLLEASAPNHLVSLYPYKDKVIAAIIDLSTTTFFVESFDLKDFSAFLGRINPSEILLSDDLFIKVSTLLIPYQKGLNLLPSIKFDLSRNSNHILNHYKIISDEALGDFNSGERIAIGVVLDYLNITQKNNLPSLPFPKKQTNTHLLIIDRQTRLNLDIDTTSLQQHSLITILDETATNAGSRLLKSYLATPLQSIQELNKRYDVIDFFYTNTPLAESIHQKLSINFDIHRSLSRVVHKKASPKDLGVLRGALSLYFEITALLLEYTTPFSQQDQTIKTLMPFYELLERALHDDILVNKGESFLKKGFDVELDHFYHLQSHGESLLEELQAKYQNETSISTLKIKNNGVLGYFVEFPLSQKHKVPDFFSHKQTLVNTLRYTTEELLTLADKIQEASYQATFKERSIFNTLLETTDTYTEELIKVADFLAMVDLSSSFALLAQKRHYTRPTLKTTHTLSILNGRHPIIEQTMKDGDFTPNDLIFDEKTSFFLITGPNMAGKSTYLKQTALIVLMAQAGLFIPADRADIGIVDRIFSRIGAGDDIASGKSTFMVEMIETATILNQATKNSLVILDELGRGTSTYDGLSLARSVSEHLAANIQSRTLFATHYHELTALESELPSLKNLRMCIKEHEGSIYFLHKVDYGASDRSYGLHVAELAGIPKHILDKASLYLNALENNDSLKIKAPKKQMTLEMVMPTLIDHPVLSYVKNLNLDDLSPRQALLELYAIKDLVKGK